MLNKISYFTKDTLITNFNDSYKEIEYLNEVDLLKVWDFDNGEYSQSDVLFVTGPSITNEYFSYIFDDGTELKVVDKCYIYDKDQGVFTSDFQIGSKTLNDKGEEVTLLSKDLVTKEVEHFGLVSDYHMNFFANGVLVSSEYNNLYPINNMTFIKYDREPKNRAEFSELNATLYNGLRISEQPILNEVLKNGINLLKTSVSFYGI
jgi:hypothetical protein